MELAEKTKDMVNPEQDISHPHGDLKVKFVSSQPSEQCGCPEEDWIMGVIEVTIHLEEDGSGHLLFYGGDWEHDFEVDCSDIAELRQKSSRLYLLTSDRGIEMSDNISRKEVFNLLSDEAYRIEKEEKDNLAWGGPDPRDRDARDQQLRLARKLRDLSVIISKMKSLET